MKNSLYVPKNTSKSSLISIIQDEITSASSSSLVTITGNQTITGIKTFSTAPVISTITNTGTLTLPTTTGTVALTSQIPTNSTYVDLTTTQTISGTKSFTAGTGISTSGVYPRTSASNQQSSTFTTPAIQIGGSTNDGIYSSTTDVIDIGTQGTNYISLQPQGIYRFVGGTVDPAIVFNQRIQAFNGANGAASPGIQIDNQNSGFYRVNQGTIGIGISGVATARWSSAGLNLFGVAGSAAAPALVLANDTTSGLYRPAANQVGISISGSQVGNWTSTGLAITGALSATTTINPAAGSAANPSLYFASDTTNGFYRVSGGVGFSSGGSGLITFNSLGINNSTKTFTEQLAVGTGGNTIKLVQFGRITITVGSAITPGNTISQSYTFPTAFSSTPTVIVSANSQNGGWESVVANNISTTGMDIQVLNIGAGNIPVGSFIVGYYACN